MKTSSFPNPALYHRPFIDTIQAPSPYYRVMRRGCQIAMTLLWKTRIFGREYEPADGGVIYISNHQSFLDPILATMALRRPGNYMARDSLFRNPLFSRLITSVNAMPIRRAAADTSALKEAMRRLKGGRSLVVFPEGTRTRKGCIGPFLPGVAMLAQRAAAWTVPVLIDGAFENWPRSRPLPGREFDMLVQYGEPIPQADAKKLKPQPFVDLVRERLIAMQHDVRRRAGRTPFVYDE